jgi:hypothetical protein
VRPYYEFTCLEGSCTYLLGGELVTSVKQTPYSGFVAPNYDQGILRYGPYIKSESGLPRVADWILDSAVRFVADDHGLYWERRLNELRKSSVYSFHNALEKRLVLLKNNYLEVLKELPELPALIPDVLSLVRILTMAKSSSLIRTGLKLGDWITKFNLQYNFGIAPDVSVLQELNRVGPSLLRLIDRGDEVESVTEYGTFHFPFHDDESWGSGSKLITRTKVNLTYPPKPVWNAIIGLYGVRLAPSLQNIWELIPGSFVVDWFTNMSARYKHVDLSLMQLAFKFNYFEHSYTIVSGLSDVNDVWEWLDSSESRLQAKYYVRDISFTVPQLAESTYDYLRVQGSPNSGILGSLLYQILRIGG